MKAYVTSITKTRGRRAFTLPEAFCASVVLAIAVIGIGASLTTTVHQADFLEQNATAVLLARQLMEEITAKPYLDPDTGTTNSREASRPLYDNVGDYDGYSDTIDASHTLSTIQSKTVSVTQRSYTRAVAVEYHATPGGSAASSGDFALVTVTVTTPSSQQIKLWKLVSNNTLMQSN